MEYQFLAYSIVLGIIIFANCVFCYKKSRKVKSTQKVESTQKVQALIEIASDTSDLPKWVINDYLKTCTVSKV